MNLGKSGVNFDEAETGILNLEENEGNVRFSTTLSPVHVAEMGNLISRPSITIEIKQIYGIHRCDELVVHMIQ